MPQPVNKISAPENDISVLRLQKRMFRIARRDPSLTLKAISMDSGIPYNNLRGYANGDHEMPISAFRKLTGVISDELLSIMLPEGRQIVEAPDDIDHDALADWADDYCKTKMAAHRADSPGGVAIVECEKDALDGKAARLMAA